MNSEQCQCLIDFFNSNPANYEKCFAFIDKSVQHFNLQLFNLNNEDYKKNNLIDVYYSPIYTDDSKFDNVNFWYFFNLLIFVHHEHFYVDPLSINDLAERKNSFIDTLEFMRRDSFVKLIKNVFVDYKKEKVKENEEIKSLILKKNYIPLVCIQFILAKSIVGMDTTEKLNTWLKKENLFFHHMVESYFNICNSIESNENSRIPEDLFVLMKQIDKEF